MKVHPEVAAALADGRAVVALESTIISHGMPFPQNVSMATDVEQIVRDAGAVPATIAVIDGICLVGLDEQQLHRLATDEHVHKATTRDVPWLITERATGATTVAATMRLAHAAGIAVFATGGAGGVHRGATDTMDVSADLTELARTPVAVVSAGFKSILDIGRTLEYLETLGVPVVVNGSDEFPSFYSRTSGHPAPRRLDGPEPLAAMMYATWRQLGLRCGISVANPIPERDEIPQSEIEAVIEDALRSMHADGVHGRDVSPYLLAAIVDRTGGRSLTANIALVRNNASLAARVAVAYATLEG